MKRTIRMIAPLLLLCLAAPAGATDETVGSFVERIATAKQIESPDTSGAAESLRASGIPLPVDLPLDQPLTEGHVATIARSLGLDVSTNRPDAPFSAEQVDLFFTSYQVDRALRGESPSQAATAAPAGARFDPLLKGKGSGKGKKKGRGFVPAEPE